MNKPERKKMPSVATDTIDLNTIPKSQTSEVAAKEQIKAGNNKVETKDGKDGVDDAHGFMRNSYYFDEKTKEVWIPLKERHRIFHTLYPNGSLISRLVTATYKFATAEAKAFKNYKDENPIAAEAGAANSVDLPYLFKKKVSQVAVSNATYRVLNQAGIPQTVLELFRMVVAKEIDEKIREKLKTDDDIFNAEWDKLVDFQNQDKEHEKKNNGWEDAETLIEELEETKLMIDFGNEVILEQEEVIRVIKNEIFMNENDALLNDVFSILKQYQTIQGKSEESTEKEEKKQKTLQKTVKPQKNVKKIEKKERNYFIAKDGKTGLFVKEFKSRKDAALWAKISPNSISAALSPTSRNRTAGGYFWTKERK